MYKFTNYTINRNNNKIEISIKQVLHYKGILTHIRERQRKLKIVHIFLDLDRNP